MAILHQGELLMSGDPAKAVESLAGRTWEKSVERALVANYLASHKVLSTRLFAGRTRVRVFADSRPDASFEPAAADLEDVYFATIKGFARPAEIGRA
jgi:ABC-2 type transport system ATP-binding protein